MLIIYPRPNESIAVVYPTGVFDINLVAAQDVPYGVPYRFISESDLPSDKSLRFQWVADFSNPDGYGLNYGQGSDWKVLERDNLGNPTILINVVTKQVVPYADYNV